MDAGMHGGAIHATQVREDAAKAIARKYVDEHLRGYTIDNPSIRRLRTMHR